MSDIRPIQTRYAGCHFRSRLEARWAVFFDAIGARWEYEPQGFVIDGRPYLPDFLLVDCGTWVEVKGNPDDLDTELIEAAALQLPSMPKTHEAGPRLMVVGPHPRETEQGDWGWLGFTANTFDDGPLLQDGWFGFGSYHKNMRPWWLGNTSVAPPYSSGDPAASWLVPVLDPYESQAVPDAYRRARSARFEHGRQGA